MMKEKKIPMRRCAGCMQSKPKKELLRIVADKEGGLQLDFTGKAQGRGVYLCPSPECLKIAKKKQAFARSLEIKIPKEKLEPLFGVIEQEL